MVVVIQRKCLLACLALVSSGTLFAYLFGSMRNPGLDVLEAPGPQEVILRAGPLDLCAAAEKEKEEKKRRKKEEWVGIGSERSNVRNIVFLETAGHDTLTARQGCAVESAARAHPTAQVRLMHTAERMNMEDPITRLLLGTIVDKSSEEDTGQRALGNVAGSFLNATAAFANTPLEPWYSAGKWKESQFMVNHLSDAFRLAVLYRLGGVYMDLDVVVLRPLDGLRDFVGLEEPKLVANGVMGFRRRHHFLQECMKELGSTYRPDLWSHNGPELITKMLKRLCGAEESEDLDEVMGRSGPRCKGVAAVPPSAFYPIHWQNWADYYNATNAAEVIMGWSGSYLIHVWNRLTSRTPVTIGSGQPYEMAARRFCPSVYELARTAGVM